MKKYERIKLDEPVLTEKEKLDREFMESRWALYASIACSLLFFACGQMAVQDRLDLLLFVEMLLLVPSGVCVFLFGRRFFYAWYARRLYRLGQLKAVRK